MNRVVVTGLGIISPVGKKDEFWQSILTGKSGVEKISRFDAADWPVQIAAEVKDFEPQDYLEHKEARRMDRFAQFAAAAAIMALSDAELKISEKNAPRTGVLVGSGLCFSIVS
ncbi:MAG TPA: beta-ketoacyl-[acyl-carrier-protein] synthase II, partial [Firmicutes bacterium]|nr:beta-ketoacyl-[acyl-carrier-protein] synthase II [Bacillota bacterium]